MPAIPFDIGKIHFIGIGGIGMSGIAEVMHNLGYDVQGSDASLGPNVQRLIDLNVPVQIGQRAENIGDASAVVVSTAIESDNAEVIEARKRLLPVLKRAEMLAELMRLKWCVAVAGTHGKTTTTSMIASLFDAANMDPTVINGGIINAYGSNARMGDGQWMVVEADESDGTFLKLPATVAICTNLDPEHLDHYGSFDGLKDAFQTFLSQVPFYGFAIICLDDPDLQTVIGRVTDRRIITYGTNPQADVKAENIEFNGSGSKFDVRFDERLQLNTALFENLFLPMPGEHNVLNALALITLAAQMKIPEQTIRRALETFRGVKRRFTKTGEWNGITVIDDYGHHPTEIAAVLKAARMTTSGQVIAVVQPHRFTRVRDLFEDFCTCFNDADIVIVSEIYPAGELPIEGISRDKLVEGLRRNGHRHAEPLAAPEGLAAQIRALAVSGDVVVCLGAGTITTWANALPTQLAEAE